MKMSKLVTEMNDKEVSASIDNDGDLRFHDTRDDGLSIWWPGNQIDDLIRWLIGQKQK